MKLICGLGNPGVKYERTRHNVGWIALDYIAEKTGVKISKIKFKATYGETVIDGKKFVFLKPQTFMNLSGECIRDFKAWYKCDNTEIIIIYDDISLPTGKLRIRPKGSAGGHNGIKSIIYQLNSEVFPRIKVGIGKPQNADYDLADYVLGRFSKDEVKTLVDTAVRAAAAVEVIIKNGTEKAMAEFNG